jgi:hypothetical protein
LRFNYLSRVSQLSVPHPTLYTGTSSRWMAVLVSGIVDAASRRQPIVPRKSI